MIEVHVADFDLAKVRDPFLRLAITFRLKQAGIPAYWEWKDDAPQVKTGRLAWQRDHLAQVTTFRWWPDPSQDTPTAASAA